MIEGITVADTIERWWYNGICYLEKGKTYYLYISVRSKNPQVRIDSECCSWEEVSRAEAICGAEGKVIYRCRTHGDTKEEILKATGKHTMGRWKVTSGPTVVAEGIQERRCTVCGRKEKAKTAKLNFTVRLNVATGKTLKSATLKAKKN